MTVTDAELVEELPGYLGWTPELARLALAAAARRLLVEAYEFARARYFGGATSSSNSSVTFLVVHGPGRLQQDPSFCALLREELLAILGQAS